MVHLKLRSSKAYDTLKSVLHYPVKKFKCAYCGEEEEWYNTEDWVYYDEEDKRYCPACVQKLISAGLYFWRMKPNALSKD